MYITCKHCGRNFPVRYKCSHWSSVRGNAPFLGADGYARANFIKHQDACKDRKVSNEKETKQMETDTCDECGLPSSENAGGLNTYVGEHETRELCDHCFRQQIDDDAPDEEG